MKALNHNWLDKKQILGKEEVGSWKLSLFSDANSFYRAKWLVVASKVITGEINDGAVRVYSKLQCNLKDELVKYSW